MQHGHGGHAGDYHHWGVGATTSTAPCVAAPRWSTRRVLSVTMPHAARSYSVEAASTTSRGWGAFEWTPAAGNRSHPLFSYLNMVVGCSSSERRCKELFDTFPAPAWLRVSTYFHGGGPRTGDVARLGIRYRR